MHKIRKKWTFETKKSPKCLKRKPNCRKIHIALFKCSLVRAKGDKRGLLKGPIKFNMVHLLHLKRRKVGSATDY